MLGLAGSRQLSNCFKFYWSARSAALIGENYTRAYTSSTSNNRSVQARGDVSGSYQNRSAAQFGQGGGVVLAGGQYDQVDASAGSTILTRAEDDNVVWNGEFQCGFAYTRQISCRTEFFVKAGMEYQYWGFLGGDTQSSVFIQDINLSSNANAQTGNIDMHLYGLNCSAGFSY